MRTPPRARAARTPYGADLAYIHATGFADYATAAAPGLVAILRDAGLAAGHVVELGCGAGTTARALVAAGHRVTGIDASPALLRLARASAPGARFVLGRLPHAALPPCDAMVAVVATTGCTTTQPDAPRARSWPSVASVAAIGAATSGTS